MRMVDDAHIVMHLFRFVAIEYGCAWHKSHRHPTASFARVVGLRAMEKINVMKRHLAGFQLAEPPCRRRTRSRAIPDAM